MPMAYASQATAAPTSGTAITLAKPAGTVSGDALVVIIAARPSSGAISYTPPAGWTAAGIVSLSASIVGQAWVKIAGGSEPASYNWTTSLAIAESAAAILRYTPSAPTSPPGVVDSVDTGTAATPAVSPGVTATGDNDTLIALFATSGSLGGTPAGMTQRATLDSGTPAIGAYDEIRTAAGATGIRTWTGSGVGGGWAILLLANQQGSRIRMMI